MRWDDIKYMDDRSLVPPSPPLEIPTDPKEQRCCRTGGEAPRREGSGGCAEVHAKRDSGGGDDGPTDDGIDRRVACGRGIMTLDEV